METTSVNAGSWKYALLFLGSGALALIYEVLWQRDFALVFGGGAPAIAAVLAAYFAGMGAGSLLLGKSAERWKSPLLAYAVLEAMVGLGALMVGPILTGFEALYPFLYEQFSDRPDVFFAVKLSMALSAILLPTFCLGGTLPVMARLVDTGRAGLGVNAGLLYAANTLGAGLGALSAPLILIPAFGTRGALWLCVAGNLTLAAVACGLNGKIETAANLTEKRASHPKRAQGPRIRSVRHDALGLAFISGFAAFALQVHWNRGFAQVHENSLYSFALIVAAVILSLALGAELSRRGLRRQMRPYRLLGAAWIASGLFAAIGPLLFLRLSGGLSYLPSDGGWLQGLGRTAGLAIAVVAAPMSLLGVGLPALMEQAGLQRDEEPGAVLGRLLAANVAGSVIGALVAGFLMPKWAGLWNGVFMIGSLLFLVGIWAVWFGRNEKAMRKGGLVCCGLFGAVLWPLAQLDLPRTKIDRDRGERLISIEEGAYGVVSVVEQSGSRRIKLNNHYALGGTLSAGDERMQAHLPLLLHPAPRRVAVLGLGTGITAGGALSHPVERLVAVELVPEVVRMAREHFGDFNARLFDDERAEVVIGDARNFLRGTRDRFDVIIGDLVVPWRQGESALFTREQFIAARNALAPGGLYCQWAPAFQLSETEWRILMRTFLSAFPKAEVIRGDFSGREPAIGLVGWNESRTPTSDDIRRRIEQMKPDPWNPHLCDPAAFWMHYAGAVEPQHLSSEETRVHSEAHPWIELLSPWRNAGELFTGTKLAGWLNEVSRRSLEREHRLDKTALDGIRAGFRLAEMIRSLETGDLAGAESARKDLEGLLPDRVLGALFPGR